MQTWAWGSEMGIKVGWTLFARRSGGQSLGGQGGKVEVEADNGRLKLRRLVLPENKCGEGANGRNVICVPWHGVGTEAGKGMQCRAEALTLRPRGFAGAGTKVQ